MSSLICTLGNQWMQLHVSNRSLPLHLERLPAEFSEAVPPQPARPAGATSADTDLLSARLRGHPISYGTSGFVISGAVNTVPDTLNILCYLFCLLKFMHLEMLVDTFSKLKNKQMYYLSVECHCLYVTWNRKKQAGEQLVRKAWWAVAETEKKWKQTHEGH